MRLRNRIDLEKVFSFGGVGRNAFFVAARHAETRARARGRARAMRLSRRPLGLAGGRLPWSCGALSVRAHISIGRVCDAGGLSCSTRKPALRPPWDRSRPRVLVVWIERAGHTGGVLSHKPTPASGVPANHAGRVSGLPANRAAGSSLAAGALVMASSVCAHNSARV